MNAPPSLWMKLARHAGSLRVTVAGLAWLAVLTVWGTIHQAGHGLHSARVTFYDTWFFRAWGVLPLPGAQLTLAVVFLNLAAAMIVLACLRALRPGILLIHAGLVLMLTAGAATFYGGREASVSLLEGQGTNLASSYSEWELAVLEADGPDTWRVDAVDTAGLPAGERIEFPAAGLSATVAEYQDHCLPARDPAATGPRPHNDSGFTGFSRLARGREPADDRPGLRLTVRQGEADTDLLLLAHDNGPTFLRIGDRELGFSLRRKRLPLPGTLSLVDFQKEHYPNSRTARRFSSRVRVDHDGVTRDVTISMNKPLRFGGHTFYQSSYRELPDGREASVFSVVRNVGRVVPYVATGITFLGLAIYFLGLLALRLRAPARTAV